jgi:hypothetical protein
MAYPETSRTLTVVHILGPDDFELALDVRIKVLDEVEVIRKPLPSDEIVDPVFVPDVTFASHIRERLDVGMDRSEQQAEIRDVAT